MTSLAWIEVIIAASMILVPIAFICHRTRITKADGTHYGDGVRVIQILGITILPQLIVLLALENKIDGGTVSALIGTAVGFIFGGLADFDRKRQT